MNFFRVILHREFRNSYPTKWAVCSQIVRLLFMLAGYWYTAKAFSPSFGTFPGAEDFFTFAIIGECVLAIPMTAMASFAGAIRQLSAEGTLDLALSLPRRNYSILFYFGLAPILIELAWTSFYILCAFFIFDFRLPPETLPAILCLQILSFPFFICLGFISAGFLLLFGRGENALDALIRASMVTAGVYFPTSVFPESLSHFLLYASPFNALLDLTRETIAQGGTLNNWAWALTYFLLFPAILMPFSLLLLKKGFYLHRLRAATLLAPVS